ncbi:MAG: hypothetical protein ABID38_07465, partial [Candidatus Diapherotrites archaeon]
TAREEVKSGMLSSLQQSRPAYVVYYRNFSLEGQTPEQYAPEISQWIEENYETEKTIGNADIMGKR